MLADIVAQPFDGVVTRIRRLQTSRRKGVAALRALEHRGIIQPETVFTGASLIKLFDLPPEGRRHCHAQGLGPLPLPTEGGILHRYLVHHAAEKLKRDGWAIEKEAMVNDQLTIDVLAKKGEQRLAVLVETGKSDVKENLEKTVAAGFADIWLVSDNPVVQRVAEVFAKDNEGKVRIELKTSTQL